MRSQNKFKKFSIQEELLDVYNFNTGLTEKMTVQEYLKKYGCIRIRRHKNG